MYEYKCILLLQDNCLIMFLDILLLLECTQSADNVLHSFTVLLEKEYFPTSDLPIHLLEVMSSSCFTCPNFEEKKICLGPDLHDHSIS